MAAETNGNMNGPNFVTLYSTKAHVFEFDPKTMKSWLQKGNHAIPITFVESVVNNQDSSSVLEDSIISKKELRIIGTDDNDNTVLNANILPGTVFQRKSENFGQWIDHTKRLHGLGFNSKDEFEEFMETFQELQNKILEQPVLSSHAQMQPLEQPRVRHQQQSIQQQHSSTSTASTTIIGMSANNLQNQDQVDNEQLIWNQQQNLSNNNNNIISETLNSQSSKVIRNPLTNNATNINKQQYNSNTLAHPGHQSKRLQQQQLLTDTIVTNQSINGNTSNLSTENGTINNNNNVSAYPRSQSMFGLQEQTINNNNNGLICSRADNLSLRGKTTGNGTPDTIESSVGGQIIQNDKQIRDQLKYENERLKQTLEENTKNASVWHNELIILRTNNVKLTQALQESKSNVDEWERELSRLREENSELKFRISALESINAETSENTDYKKELQKYKNFVEGIQTKLRRKEMEIEDLQKSMEVLELKAQHPEQNGNSSTIKSVNKQKLDVINAKLDAKISELTNVQREFTQLLDRLNY